MKNLHVIVGLGVTGLSCVRYLLARGVPIVVMDTRPNPPHLEMLNKLAPNIPVVLGKLDKDWLDKAEVVVLSPGIALTQPEVAAVIAKGTKVIGDIELFAQAAKAPIIGITGTNAKSTVTTLVGMMLREAGLKVEVGGNLGVPALDLIKPNIDAYVLELSSFQLETTYGLKAKVATVLNITPDHMDRYKTLTDYQKAKLRVYDNCEIAVCNRDDPLTECANTKAKKIYFTMEKPGKNEFGLIADNLYFENTKLINIKEMPVEGKHYQANALSALAIGYAYDIPFEPMLKVLRQFQGLAHRCQLVRELNQVKWYNDSKGTNVGASKAAIEGLGCSIDGKLILIAGGLGKNADFSPLLTPIEKYSRHVVLIGAAAKELATVIGKRIPITFAESMEQAVFAAAKVAKAKDSVLLSPACASWDMYKNFEHRGEVFMEIVRRLEY